jgi:hypothetical protein
VRECTVAGLKGAARRGMTSSYGSVIERFLALRDCHSVRCPAACQNGTAIGPNESALITATRTRGPKQPPPSFHLALTPRLAEQEPLNCGWHFPAALATVSAADLTVLSAALAVRLGAMQQRPSVPVEDAPLEVAANG